MHAAPLIPGNVGNAMSYDFPVRYKVMKGLPSDWWCDEIGPDERDVRSLSRRPRNWKQKDVRRSHPDVDSLPSIRRELLMR